jgi:hypothetical protein
MKKFPLLKMMPWQRLKCFPEAVLFPFRGATTTDQRVRWLQLEVMVACIKRPWTMFPRLAVYQGRITCKLLDEDPTQ